VNHSALPSNDLLMACICGDASAWEEFIRRFSPVIARVVFRVACRHGDSSKSVVDDLVQDTYLKLCSNDCKLLKSFEPEHTESIFAFLKVVASCVAHDYFKAKHAQKRGSGNTPETLDEMQYSAPGDSANSPGSLTRIERGVLIRQIDEYLSTLLPPVEAKRGRAVFWLYYRAGFSASAIASLPAVGLTTKGVESLLLRTTRIVRRRLADPTQAEKRVT
jgi:RNA polymerase sigma-70 factor (ECF subfamily)